MPRAKEHMTIGALSGAAVNLAIQLDEMAANPEKQFDWMELLACIAVGAAAGLIPDLLEPATSPRHRSFFHSATAGALIAWQLSGKDMNQLPRDIRMILLVAGASYGSHLLADSMTPASIRLI